MSFPSPQPGLVIRYAYLWAAEFDRGLEEGSKDRPCAILLAVKNEDGGQIVTVLPITHGQPQNPDHAIEIPMATKRRLGLDEERSWIVLTESNRFIWPGPDLRPARSGDDQSIVYGLLPATLYEQIKQKWIQLYQKRLGQITNRTE